MFQFNDDMWLTLNYIESSSIIQIYEEKYVYVPVCLHTSIVFSPKGYATRAINLPFVHFRAVFLLATPRSKNNPQAILSNP